MDISPKKAKITTELKKVNKQKITQSHFKGRRKKSWGEGETGRGKGKDDDILGWGQNRIEALKTNRKNGNRQPWEVGGGQGTVESTRDLGGERHSGLGWRDLR